MVFTEPVFRFTRRFPGLQTVSCTQPQVYSNCRSWAASVPEWYPGCTHRVADPSGQCAWPQVWWDDHSMESVLLQPLMTNWPMSISPSHGLESDWVVRQVVRQFFSCNCLHLDTQRELTSLAIISMCHIIGHHLHKQHILFWHWHIIGHCAHQRTILQYLFLMSQFYEKGVSAKSRAGMQFDNDIPTSRHEICQNNSNRYIPVWTLPSAGISCYNIHSHRQQMTSSPIYFRDYTALSKFGVIPRKTLTIIYPNYTHETSTSISPKKV